MPAFAEFQDQHPSIAFVKETARHDPVAISDFLSVRGWHKRDLYKEFFAVLGLEDQLAITVPVEAPMVLGVALNRTRRGFTERDRAVLGLFGVHLTAAYRNAEALNAVQQVAETSMGALEDARHGLASVTPTGRIRRATDLAQRWLDHYFPDRDRSGDRLPGYLKAWLGTVRPKHGDEGALRAARSMTIDRGTSRLTIRLVPERVQGGDWLLVMEEQDLAAPNGEDPRVAALPPRLKRVLFRLLTGDSEKEIANQLSLSRHTVHEYVKVIYARLDVSSRSELMARWIRR
jgi:DNA-binding CsgD family transcriptional regulator